MLFLSKFPILTEDIRTLQYFLWKEMPGAMLPDDPDTPEPDDWYSAEELDIFRLSSKSHWDVPIEVNGTAIHVLCSHPTPPVFDGPEDRNGRRNHDEIRLWADYVTPGAAPYLYDDNIVYGGLEADTRFVILGDQNADPVDGDSTDDAILQLLDNPNVNATFAPESSGAAEQSDDATDTASWGLRADYVLPSSYGLVIRQGCVFWPITTDILYRLVEDDGSSDHRLVWLDLTVEPDATAGDIDGDGDVDRDDINIIRSHRGEPASLCPECDIDGDGVITVRDARKLVKICTRPRCLCE
jgi:3-phytase